MCRTTTSVPKCPLRLTTSSFASVRPTSVRRNAAIAACGCSSETRKSCSSTSSAGSPSRVVTRFASAPVMVRAGATGWQPWVTRDTSCTPSPKATPDRPPRNTPPALPCPLMLPLPPMANCTTSFRLEASPPNR